MPDKIDLSLDEIIKQDKKAKAKKGMPVSRMRGALRGKRKGTGVSPLNRTQLLAAQLKKTSLRGRGRGRGRGAAAISRGGRGAVVATGRGRGRGRGLAMISRGGRGAAATGRGRGTGQVSGLARARVEVAVNRVQLAKEKLEEAKQRLAMEQKKSRENQFMSNRQIQSQSTRGVRARGGRGRGRGRLVRPSVEQYQNIPKRSYTRQAQNQSQMLSVRFSNIQQPQARQGNTVSSFRGGRGRGRSSAGGRKVFF